VAAMLFYILQIHGINKTFIFLDHFPHHISRLHFK